MASKSSAPALPDSGPHPPDIESGPPPRLDELPELITIDEFIKVTRIGRTAAYGMVRDEKIPIVRLGRHIRVPRSVLEAK